MTALPPKIGVMLSTFDTWGTGIGDVVGDARTLEELGFDSVWVGDHLHFNIPMLEAFSVLSAVAAATDHVALGSAVLLAALRHPAWVAKQTATLQRLSRERFVLGVGVGGEKPEEWSAANVPTTERGRRTNIILEALGPLSRGEPHTLPAPFATDVPPLLPAAAPPRVWIGGRSDAAMRRTIRFGDAWLGAFAHAKLFRGVAGDLQARAEQAGRRTPEMASVLFVHVGDDRDRAERSAREFVARQYRVPFESMDRYVIRGPEAEVIDAIVEFVDIGLSHFVVIPVDPDPQAQYPALARVRARVQRRATTKSSRAA